MNLNRLIVHELRKVSGSTETELILSNELIPIDYDSNELVEILLKSYQGDKILYAEFDNSPGKYFPEQFIEYSESEKEIVDFINFIINTTGNLETIIRAKVLAKGGYIVFAEYVANGINFTAIFLIRDTEGKILDRNQNGYRIQTIEYLDTRHLAMACRIDKNKIENNESNYLSFTRLKQQEVSDYFTDWISIVQLESSTDYTNQLYSIINALPLPYNGETNERFTIDEVRNMVFENARNNANQTIDLRLLSQQIYGNQDTIMNYVEENGISIDSEFRFDKRALRRFVQISVRRDGISLKFSRGEDNKVHISEENPNVVIIESAIFANALRQQLGDE